MGPNAVDVQLDLVQRVRGQLGVHDLDVAVRFERLLEIVSSLGSCVVALSGGIDSSVMLAVAASLLGERCLAATVDSVAVPEWDRTDAGEAAEAAGSYGAGWRVIPTAVLDDPRYASNTPARCYFCKLDMYRTMGEVARSGDYAWVIDGTNASDVVHNDRPGITAAAELGVRSPLVEAGITKTDVRVLARALGLADPERPSSACLASRIPFGVSITPERLRRVEAAELALRSVAFRQVRVRDFGTWARVEVEREEMDRIERHRSFIDGRLRELGFTGWEAHPYTGTGAGASADATS